MIQVQGSLSEKSLEDALIQIEEYKQEHKDLLSIKPSLLIIHPENWRLIKGYQAYYNKTWC